MNLQLNPEQLVTLYELISEASFSKTANKDCLIQLRKKLSGMILESLEKIYQSQNKQKHSIWENREQEKLRKLNLDLEKIKEVSDPKYPSDDGLYFPPEI